MKAQLLIATCLFGCLAFSSQEFSTLVENLRGKYPSLKDEHVETFAKVLVQHNTIYGNASLKAQTPVPFECTTYGPSPEVPTSVHKLRPADIKVVAALGDSLTAAFGAKSRSLFSVFTEFRGVSWSIGGDSTVSDVLTLPNILKQYNPNIIGFSVGTGTSSSSNSRLNRAVTGARSKSLANQASDLVDKISSDFRINVALDWKLVTILIGGNDLCDYCDDMEKFSPDVYQQNVREALRILKANLPRVFVNLVLQIDVTKLYDVNGGLCSVLHSYECYCATSDDKKDRKAVYEARLQYNQKLIDLAQEQEFVSEDFAVVIQPFLKDTDVPRDSNGDPDLDYLAPDCFHFSYLAHEAAAVALWNNMVEAIPKKLTTWTVGEPIECPEEGEYLYTAVNSR